MNLASWRTSLVGIFAFLAVLGTQAGNALDSDPMTLFDLDIVLAALPGALVGLFARDNATTSEKAGAR